jgi:hypothetical protein
MAKPKMHQLAETIKEFMEKKGEFKIIFEYGHWPNSDLLTNILKRAGVTDDDCVISFVNSGDVWFIVGSRNTKQTWEIYRQAFKRLISVLKKPEEIEHLRKASLIMQNQIEQAEGITLEPCGGLELMLAQMTRH